MRNSFLILLCLLCLPIISGCWNRRELNELAVSVAVGIDKSDKGIILSDQILNTSAISGKRPAAYAPVNLFQETGQSFQEAARRMTRKSTRKIYVGQLQMLVLGEDFAKEGVAKVLDHITRDHEYRNDFYVVIARNSEARDILKVLTPLERTPATKLKNSLEVSSRAWGASTAVEFWKFTSSIISKGKEAVLTGVKVEGSDAKGNTGENVNMILPSARLTYAGLAVFKKDKLIGWLNEKESLGYNFTQGNIKSVSLLQSCPDSSHVMTVELLQTNSKMKALLDNGKPTIHIAVQAEGVVTDAQCPLDFMDPVTVTQIEEISNAQIKSYINSAVRKMQNRYNSDIFGFGEQFERKYPRYWKQVKGRWYDVFPDVDVKIETKVNVEKMFKTTKSFDERMKE